MKPIEDAFASETLRRIVLPGIVLATGVHPLIAGWLSLIASAYGVDSTVLLVIEIILFGLLVSSAVQWIYYVYEGFRFRVLTALSGEFNDNRVRNLMNLKTRLMSQSTRSASENNRLEKTYAKLGDYPVRRGEDGSIKYFAERPTLLGNIIASYELYPGTRFSVDGVAYWYHLLSFAPESTRNEFAGRYAFAESLVLTSSSGALVAVLHMLVLVGFLLGGWFPSLVLVRLRIGPATSALLLFFGLGVWLCFYLAALSAHREAGRLFRSIVDITMPCFIKWLKKVRVPTSEAEAKLATITDYLAEPSSSSKSKIETFGINP